MFLKQIVYFFNQIAYYYDFSNDSEVHCNSEYD